MAGFEPNTFEDALYREWESAGCFEAQDKNAPGQAAFSIMIPPPNVTGVLHIGHALTNTIQDILVRWRRMRGDNALWMPGTDHAGIATQAQVEKQLAKEKGPSGRPLTRHDIGREEFLKRTWKWKEDHAGQIQNQLRKMGASLDWKRERFTMDPGMSAAVREVFVRLHEDGLIYRGERIINWCPRCQTALSDLEVVPQDRKGNLWHIRYVRADDPSAELIVATTRPETLLGDTAVAVHPEDERFTTFHGKFVVVPLTGRKVPVIADAYVEREFGTGALKVTPAHDFNDADLGKKHSLPAISVMGKDGRITSEGGVYAGLNFQEAREKILEDLKAQGLLVKVEDHALKVGLCQRCERLAEPILSKQWFVKIAPLAEPAIEAVKSGKIQFTPPNWEKTYFEWMNNIRDWCISRQLWWGHQIPAWHCDACSEITVSRETPAQCLQCGSSKLKQDEDVLDTWFSSGLWPFATLGWPEKTPALKTFYPTSILETGFDIIFFWVARMIMMGIHFMGDVPFKKVYLHAMVRDEKGEKMSKSKGNVIDPLDVIGVHGADALRFTLASMAGQGRDIKLSVDRVEGYRAFVNKFYNAVQFLKIQLENSDAGPVPAPAGGTFKWLVDHRPELTVANRWILAELQTTITKVESGLERFELDESARALYEFVWFGVCDWYIEFSKLSLREGGTQRLQTIYTLTHVMETALRLMHPFMPFITEKLWRELPWTLDSELHAARRVQTKGSSPFKTLMLAAYPTAYPGFRDVDAEHSVAAIRSVIDAIRTFRGENNISPKVEFEVKVHVQSPAAEAFLRLYQGEILSLARIKGLKSVGKEPAGETETVLPLSHPPIELRIDLRGLVDVAEEAKRIRKEIEKVDADILFVGNKLSKESFIAKAPPDLVIKERAKLKEFEVRKQELQAALVRLDRLQ